MASHQFIFSHSIHVAIEKQPNVGTFTTHGWYGCDIWYIYLYITYTSSVCQRITLHSPDILLTEGLYR